ncbi:MAG: phosphatase PAP2 family protein [Spirochaetia bacterium]|nr:phosphatase PAP2 family protein [Spirochaetia bacterium]
MDFLSKNKNNVFIYLIIFIFAGLIIHIYNHSIFNLINGFWPDIFSYPMLFLTSFADGFFVLIFLTLLYPYRKNEYFSALIAFIVTGIFVQLIKYYFPMPRPLSVFPEEDIFILGMQIRTRSFPSGHSTSAMVLAWYLTRTDKTLFKYLFFSFGALSCLSRVYIGVHFPLDIWVGGWLGFVSSIFFHKYLIKYKIFINRGELKSIVINILGVLIVFIYIFFYNEKTKELEFILTPVTVLLSLYFIYRAIVDYKFLTKNKA